MEQLNYIIKDVVLGDVHQEVHVDWFYLGQREVDWDDDDTGLPVYNDRGERRKKLKPQAEIVVVDVFPVARDATNDEIVAAVERRREMISEQHGRPNTPRAKHPLAGRRG